MLELHKPPHLGIDELALDGGGAAGPRHAGRTGAGAQHPPAHYLMETAP